MTEDEVVGLTLSIEQGDDGAVVSVGGDLEFATAAPLRAALLELSQTGTRRLVLDLNDVQFIDSSGISLLVQAKQRFDADGHQFVLRAAGPRVLRVLEVAGLVELFSLE